MNFNPAAPTTMLLDVNSCFATIEQQANPRLRGRPVVVAAYTTPGGCILAASREAKTFGIATGMRVRDGMERYPRLIVLPSDPEKYRAVNRALTALLETYTDALRVESIDEMVMNFEYAPALVGVSPRNVLPAMLAIAQEIKARIKTTIGEFLTVSIGIAPNQYLAKTASNLQKPDGLVSITEANILSVLAGMKLEDLSGIKDGNAGRLRARGIGTPVAMFCASPPTLARAFGSRIGFDWWAQLHGWHVPWRTDEIKTIGHSHALGKAYEPQDPRLHQILSQLIVKTGRRLRAHNFRAGGIHVSCMFADYTSWGHGEKQAVPLFANEDLYEKALGILRTSPTRPVRILAVTCFALSKDLYLQQSLFAAEGKKERLAQAIDGIDARWGEFTVVPARMLGMEQKVQDRIAFGGMRGRIPTS